VPARVAYDWGGSTGRVSHDPTAKANLPAGRQGSCRRRHASHPLLAETLRVIAKKGRAGFYEGAVMQESGEPSEGNSAAPHRGGFRRPKLRQSTDRRTYRGHACTRYRPTARASAR